MGARIVNDDGSFGVDIHLPGPVKLLVTQAGVEQWIGGPTFEEATTFELEAGETISGVELVQCGLRLSVDTPARSVGERRDPVLRSGEPGPRDDILVRL